MNPFYEITPEIRDYFESLPIKVKNQIIESGVKIANLDELKEIAGQFIQNG